MTPEEIQRILRDWNAVMSAQTCLNVALANMTEHLQRLLNEAQKEPPSD